MDPVPDHIGGGKAPILDTWWQTETGAIMISPLPGITTTKPGSATFALPGIDVDVVTENGESVPNGEGGYLVIRKPWPSMLRGIYGDPEWYASTYWSKYEGLYFPGDGAKKDEDGYTWLLGRVDDVMNVSGHRLSTTGNRKRACFPRSCGRGGRCRPAGFVDRGGDL